MKVFSLILCLIAVNAAFAGDSGGKQIQLTILYDNYVVTEGTKADWGFACLIEGGKTILFDTGTRGDILMHNVKKLGVDLNKVDMVVLSHDHGDHTGGLATVLGIKSDVSVYFPVSFPEGFASGAAKTVRVDDPVKLCEYGSLTGEMGTEIKEQSLILDTKEGIVVVTGCSHQGIVSIVEKAKALTGKPIHLVFGGFHLMRHSEKAVDEIISRFKELGVQNVGATHCTGDRAIAQFKEAFGDHYVPMGVGKRMTFSL